MITQLAKVGKLPAMAEGTTEPRLDPVDILGRLEAVLSAGIAMQRASQGSGVNVLKLSHMLCADRPAVGARDQWGDDTQETKDLRALSVWLNELEAKRRAESLDQIATPTRAMIEGIARRALRKKSLVSLVGAYGIGKSSTLEWFARANPMTRATPGAAYVVFTKDDKGPADVYRKISEATRHFGDSRRRSLGSCVRDGLRHGDLLLCDNANYLVQAGCINVLADIYDQTPASLVVAANPVYAKLTAVADDDHDAFCNRAETVRIEKSSEGDVEAILLARGLSGEALRSAAIKIGTRHGRDGGLRVLFKVINRAEERAAQVGRRVDAKIFAQSAHDLWLP